MAPRLSFVESFSELVDTRCFDNKNQDSTSDLSRTSRAVSFALHEDVRFSTLEQSTPREITWYTKADIEQFKKENSRCVQAMVSGKHRQMADFCERGLEGMTRAGSVLSKNRKKFACKVVLDEQGKQRENGHIDADAIALAYENASMRSRMAAAAQGQNDAREAHC